jgi:hypothetical protein
LPEIVWILGGMVGVFAGMVGGGLLAANGLRHLMGAGLANLGTAQRLHGGWSGARPSPLLMLELADPRAVAAALADLDDETVAGVLARVRPRFGRRVLRALPEGRLARVVYWLDRPQPFPRNAQAALARKLKKRLGLDVRG